MNNNKEMASVDLEPRTAHSILSDCLQDLHYQLKVAEANASLDAAFGKEPDRDVVIDLLVGIEGVTQALRTLQEVRRDRAE